MANITMWFAYQETFNEKAFSPALCADVRPERIRWSSAGPATLLGYQSYGMRDVYMAVPVAGEDAVPDT